MRLPAWLPLVASLFASPFLATSGAPVARAEDGLFGAVAALAAEIHSVASLGRWSDQGHGGTYRVVVLQGGAEVPATRVFVQWMEETEGGVLAVKATVEVAAFTELAGATLQGPAWRNLGRNRLELTITARTPDGGRHRLRRIATTPGRLVPR